MDRQVQLVQGKLLPLIGKDDALTSTELLNSVKENNTQVSERHV
jgi:hypothetical protein